jgi:hypothetical protein
MADETERSKDLVARQIGKQLRQGNLDGLIQAHRAVQASFTLHVSPSLGEPARADGDFGDEGTLSAHVAVVVTPEVNAEGGLVPQEVVDAIRSALPQLANDMQTRPRDAMLLLTAFMALMALLTAAMQAYQLFHPQAPTPPPIESSIRPTTS